MQLKLALLAAGALVLSSCAKELASPRYALGECRRVNLTDSETGAGVVGAEDLAIDRAGGRLFVSAYDRRAAEKAAQKNGGAPPQGGVYAVALDDLFEAQGMLSAKPWIDPATVSGGLRPHGIDFHAETGRVAFINRGYEKTGQRWRMTPALVEVDDEGDLSSGDTHCAANDVAGAGEETLVSYSHASCGFGAAMDNIFNRRNSGAFFAGGETLIDDLKYANGAVYGSEQFAVAATRENAMYLFKSHEGLHYNEDTIELPGAPDNITAGKDGAFIVAIHPSLFRLTLNRKLGWGRAPSRIVSVAADDQDIEILYDDPKGDLFSAATVGVETGRGLIAGSVTDRGLLVCEKSG